VAATKAQSTRAIRTLYYITHMITQSLIHEPTTTHLHLQTTLIPDIQY